MINQIMKKRKMMMITHQFQEIKLKRKRNIKEKE